MAHQSFAKTVYETIKEAALAGNGEVSAQKLSCLLKLPTRKDHKRMLNALSDLARNGKIIRVRQGVYAPGTTAATVDKREVMWRLLKMRRVVTSADLQEMAGVSATYAKEWLGMLVRRKVAIRIAPPNHNHPHSYRLIKNDLNVMPVDEDKATRLRKMRLEKKAALSGKLDAIDTAVKEMKNILQTMEGEE